MASFWISVLIQNHFALEQWVEKRLLKQMDRLVHQYPHVEGAGGNEESLYTYGLSEPAVLDVAQDWMPS